MKYKKGDRFILEIGEVTDFRLPYVIKGTKVCLSETVIDDNFTKLSVTAEELAEAIDKLLLMPARRVSEIFGPASVVHVLRDFTPEQIIEKLNESIKIQIGSVVETDYGEALVFNVHQDPVTEKSYFYCMNKDKQIRLIEESHIKKTNKALDIEGFLQGLGG